MVFESPLCANTVLDILYQCFSNCSKEPGAVFFYSTAEQNFCKIQLKKKVTTKIMWGKKRHKLQVPSLTTFNRYKISLANCYKVSKCFTLNFCTYLVMMGSWHADHTLNSTALYANYLFSKVLLRASNTYY